MVGKKPHVNLLPRTYDVTFDKVVKVNKYINEEKFKNTFIAKVGKYWNGEHVGDLDIDDDQKKTSTIGNIRRMAFLTYFLKYRSKDHVDLIDFTIFQETIPMSMIKIFMEKPFFINFNLNESSLNLLLEQQGFLLKTFHRFYLINDMNNRAYIDSRSIEINNPLDRQRIRKFNKLIPHVQSRYFELSDSQQYKTSPKFNIVGFCFHLIDNYFPDISGIWANYYHIAPIVTLEIIRVCFEYGWFDEVQSKIMVTKQVNAIENIKKLEASWKEKFLESDIPQDQLASVKLNLRTGFLEIREHVAAILIQIITVVYDEQFEKCDPLDYFNKYKDREPNQVPLIAYLIWYDETISEHILRLCMNYLIIPLDSDFYTNDERETLQNVMTKTSSMTEKLFLYVASVESDLFYLSLKGVSINDYEFFENQSDNQLETQLAKTFNLTIIKLLAEFSLGKFDKEGFVDVNKMESDLLEKDLLLDKNDFNKIHLKRLFEEALEFQNIAHNEDDDEEESISNSLKICLSREGTLSLLMTFVRILEKAFSHPRIEALQDRIYWLILKICENNNSAKAELFKTRNLNTIIQMITAHNLRMLNLMNVLAENETNFTKFLNRQFFEVLTSFYTDLKDELYSLWKDWGKKHKFDKGKWLSLYLVNQLQYKLSRQEFTDYKGKISFQYGIQNVLYNIMASAVFPSYISLLVHPLMNNSHLEDMLPRKLFESGNENMFLRLIKERDITRTDSFYIVLNICHTLLRTFNNVTSNSYSSNLKKVISSNLRNIRMYFCSPICTNNEIIPKSKDTEILRLLLNFAILPETSVSLECCPAEDVAGFDSTEEIDLIEALMNKKLPKYFAEDRKYEAKKFLIEGVFLMIYKYTVGNKNLVDLNDFYLMIKQYEKFKRIIDLLKNQHREAIESQLNIGSIQFDELCDVDKGISDFADAKQENLNVEDFDGGIFDDEDTNQKDKILRLRGQFRIYSNSILMFLRKLYMTQGKEYLLKRFEHMTYKQYKRFIITSNFNNIVEEKKVNDKELETPEQEMEKKIRDDQLSYMVRFYRKSKELYLKQNSGVKKGSRMINFFDNNPDNMNGLFDSALLRLMGGKTFMSFEAVNQNRAKTLKYIDDDKDTENDIEEEKEEDMGSLIEIINIDTPYTESIAIALFWSDPISTYYIKIIERLISTSTKARLQLYKYMEAKDKIKNMDNPVNFLFILLARIHYDCLRYLSMAPAKNYLWWEIYRSYKRLSKFFQNLCENNNMNFKKLFADKSRMVNPDYKNWEFYNQSLNYVFIREIKYILSLSTLCSNEDTTLDPEIDKEQVVMPQLVHLIELVNEYITGPCIENQRCFIDAKIKLGGIIFRMIDDLTDDFYIIKNLSIKLIIALTEGLDQKIMKKLSQKFPSAQLEEQIYKLLKKLYVKEKFTNLKKSGRPNKEENYIMSTLAETCKEKRKYKYELLKQKFPGVTEENKPQPEINSKYKKQLTKLKDLSKSGPKLIQHSITQINLKAKSTKKHLKRDYENNKNKLQYFNQNKLKDIMEETELGKKQYLNEFDIVTDHVSNLLRISHSSELTSLYKSNEDFSESIILDTVFNLYLLWLSLANYSETHANKLKEINRRSEQKVKQEYYLGNLLQGNKSFLRFWGKSDVVNQQNVVQPSNVNDGSGVEINTVDNKKAANALIITVQKSVTKEEVVYDKTTELTSVFKFLDRIKLSVEIKENKNSNIVYFMKSPMAYFQTDETVGQYFETYQISDSEKKMSDQINKYDVFEKEMSHNLYQYRTNKLAFTLTSNDMFNIFTIQIWFLSFIMNGFIIFNNELNYNHTTFANDSTIELESGGITTYGKWYYKYIISYLRLIIGGLSIIFQIIWLISQFNNTWDMNKLKYLKDNPTVKRISWLINIKICIYDTLLFNDLISNLIFHPIFAGLGQVSYRFWDSLHLIQILNISPQIKFIFNSVFQHFTQLLRTQCFMIFIFYFFATYIIEFYYDLWNLDGENGSSIQPCMNLMECFVYTLNLGLRNGGGIADSFFLYSQSNSEKIVGLSIFSILFFLIIQVICLNIVFGIIIDSFSEQRDARNIRDDDLSQNCFVCGNTRATFINSNNTFDNHCSKDHSPWHYIYYILYLKQKGYQELTGLESVIWQLYKKGKMTWLPIGDTYYLPKEVQDESAYEKLEIRIDDLEKNLNKDLGQIMQKLNILLSKKEKKSD